MEHRASITTGALAYFIRRSLPGFHAQPGSDRKIHTSHMAIGCRGRHFLVILVLFLLLTTFLIDLDGIEGVGRDGVQA